jgi:hypothetical protein
MLDEQQSMDSPEVQDRLAREWARGVGSIPVREPTTLQEMHARVLQARSRQASAALDHARRVAQIQVRPEPELPPRSEQDELEILQRRAARIVAEHEEGAAWTGHEVLILVGAQAGITAETLKSDTRVVEVCQPRQAFFWLARRFTSLSLPQIGQLAGGRDHTTALHGVRRVDRVVALLGEPDEDTPGAWAKHLLSRAWQSAASARRAQARLHATETAA